ncbi:hypothetical protein VAEU17_330035 [Vibrio aestuarianus]|nr:hypothetical protein VAEU17_330035 [Vibrio aestuarianus]
MVSFYLVKESIPHIDTITNQTQQYAPESLPCATLKRSECLCNAR